MSQPERSSLSHPAMKDSSLSHLERSSLSLPETKFSSLSSHESGIPRQVTIAEAREVREDEQHEWFKKIESQADSSEQGMLNNPEYYMLGPNIEEKKSWSGTEELADERNFFLKAAAKHYLDQLLNGDCEEEPKRSPTTSPAAHQASISSPSLPLSTATDQPQGQHLHHLQAATLQVPQVVTLPDHHPMKQSQHLYHHVVSVVGMGCTF